MFQWDQSAAIVMALCTEGDLEGRANDGHWGVLEGAQMCPLPYCEMILITLQMLFGIDYVHTVAKMIHRDIAARNIMLTEIDGILTAQLADLGMTREMDDSGTYAIAGSKAKLPIAWGSPESLKKKGGIATAALDMWAIGVTIDEMVTNCSGKGRKGPYLEEGTIRKKVTKSVKGADGEAHEVEVVLGSLAGNSEILGFIQRTKNKKTGLWEGKSERLHIPDECPAELRVLMTALWSKKASDRPTALQSIVFLCRACAPIFELPIAWKDPDPESAAKMAAMFGKDGLNIEVPHALEVFEQFNYKCFVDDDNLPEDTRTLLEGKGEAGADYILGDSFKALKREVAALRMLNKAVQQEPLKSALEHACARHDGTNDTVNDDMQDELHEKLLKCKHGSRFTAWSAQEVVRKAEEAAAAEAEEAARVEAARVAEVARVAAVEAARVVAEAAAKKKAEEDEAARVAEEKRVTSMEDVENQMRAFAECVGLEGLMARLPMASALSSNGSYKVYVLDGNIVLAEVWAEVPYLRVVRTFGKENAHTGEITALAISADMRQIFSQSDEDGTAKIWNTLGKCIITRAAVLVEELTDTEKWNGDVEFTQVPVSKPKGNVASEKMWEGVTRGEDGEILKIEWKNKNLKGTLPVGDLFMPFLTHMDLGDNKELTGEI